MNNIEIIDNFFENFENIKEEFKKVPLYTCLKYKKLKTYRRVNMEDCEFPGQRSDALHISSPFLFNLILREIFLKINAKQYTQLRLDCGIHLRLANDNEKDFIHTDNASEESFLNMLIYLSETNLNSGTGFYKEGIEEPYLIVPFIKNTAVFFPGHKIRHKSLLNYGKNIRDGRLTLNGFIRALK